MSPSKRNLFAQTTVCAAALGAAFLAGRATVDRSARPNVQSGNLTKLRTSTLAPLELKAGAAAMAAGGAASQDSNLPESSTRQPSALTPEQVSARLKAMFDNADPVSRMSDYLDLLKTLGTNEARSAALATLMENFNPRERARELNMLMTTWADSDPVAALTAVKDNKDWTGQMAAGTVLSKWVKSDPDQAIAWATENGKEANNTETGNYYMVGLIGTLAKTDLDRAATLAETSMNRSRARGDAMDRVLEQSLKQRSAAATQAWATGLAQSPFKDGVLSRLAGQLASKDAPSAAAWASTLPENEAKPRVLSEIVDRWSREQPNEAGAWLNQFPPSAATDSPRETFARQVNEKDPEAAMAWASTITDEKRRERATSDLIKNWVEREPAAARQWVDNAPNLSEKIKERFGTKPHT